MAKQKCGTCRFFQEAGLASSGWCHHPQRKVSSDVMIMVRSSELACRDDWAKSLWEPLQRDEPTEASYQRPASLGPTKPASLENMRSLLQADTTIAAESLHGEDVLLSEGRIISEVHEPPPQAVRPVQGGGFDPRTAVMKAREAYRERARARDAAARHSAGAAAIVEQAAEFPAESDVPHAFSEGGSAAGAETPAESLLAPSDHVLADGGGEQAAETSWHHNGTDDLAEADAGEALPTWDAEHALSAHETSARPAGEQALSEQSTNGAPAEAALPAWFRTDLPRVCRTCRDYRPSSEGERGWCANAWAFTHRRLVQEDDAAPCAASFGDWWAPVDDVWLVAADVSSHSRATPLLDQLTGHERGRRRRS